LDILATGLDGTHTFELRRDGVAVQTVTYTVQAYVFALQDSTNDTYRNLVRTLYNYGLSCIAYAS
jgi:hypothetical protein